MSVPERFDAGRERLSQWLAWIVRTDADRACLFAILVAGAYVYYVRLGSYPLMTWDEAIYANAALNAADHGYWSIPHLQGYDSLARSPYLKKPPLAIWLQALSILVLGPNELAVRLPSATAAILSAVVVYLLARDVADSTAGLVGALAFVATAGLYAEMNGGRFGATDTLHTLFGSTVLYLLWLQATDRATIPPVATGAVAAALLLTKGLAAGVFALAAVPLLWGLWIHTSVRKQGLALVTALGIALPWAVYAYDRYPEYFVEEIFVDAILGRVSGAIPPADPGVLPFMKFPAVATIQSTFAPWVYLFAVAVVVAPLAAARDGERRELFDTLYLGWWSLSIFLFFATFGTSTWYLIPVYVPACALVGVLVERASRLDPPGLLGVVVGAALVVAAGRDGQLVVPDATGRALADVGPAFDWVPVGVLGALVLGSALFARLRTTEARIALRKGWAFDVRQFRTQLVALALVGCVVLGVVGAPVTSVPERDVALERLGTETNRHVPADDPVYVQNVIALGQPISAYAFYANREMETVPITAFGDRSDVTYALVEGPPSESVLDREVDVLATSSTLGWALVRVGGDEGDAPAVRESRGSTRIDAGPPRRDPRHPSTRSGVRVELCNH